jgi:hypothetical protein
MPDTNLNGYTVITHTFPGIITARLGTKTTLSRAYGVVIKGRFVALDVSGAVCTGRLTRYEDNVIHYECTWDATAAEPNFTLVTPEFRLTRQSVSYASTLTVSDVNGKLIAIGEIKYGPFRIIVGVQRINEIDLNSPGVVDS